jgi:UbiD family decarboxylase
MSFRETLKQLESQSKLVVIKKPVSKSYQAAAILKKLEPRPMLFDHIQESAYKVAGNLLCSKATFADYFHIPPHEVIFKLANAIDQRSPCHKVETAPCQEVVQTDPDLNTLPILRHFEQDGGNYITSGVMIARHPKYGQNADFHRCMQFSNNEMALRVVRTRHFDIFLNDLKAMDVAICVGVSPNVLAAAATSVEIGIDELEIANALEPLQVIKAKTVDLLIPAESEFVLEGTVYLDRRHAEGPFVDLTETEDIVRQEPVFVVKAITHRSDAIWQALLPGGQEHKLLMGMPREPTIYKRVNQVVKCLDVHVNPGGCSWLHAIVQIDKQHAEDGKKAIRAAFAGHKSCKHVFVVDRDIDIYNPLEVEWAIATRFQGDRGLVIIGREPGSSLDPSSDPDTYQTMKIGFDLTKPIGSQGKSYSKIAYPEIDLSNFLPTALENMNTTSSLVDDELND